MTIEIGQTTCGTVLRVMPYGVIVRLENGIIGLVHISEVAHTFVEDLNQHCSQGASVTVRVLRQRDDGKWEFSIKQALNRQLSPGETTDNFGAEQPMYDAASSHQEPPRSSQNAAKREAFDASLRDFLSDSSENLEDARRHDENRRKGKRR